jgi:hypothetical protein
MNKELIEHIDNNYKKSDTENAKRMMQYKEEISYMLSKNLRIAKQYEILQDFLGESMPYFLRGYRYFINKHFPKEEYKKPKITEKENMTTKREESLNVMSKDGLNGHKEDTNFSSGFKKSIQDILKYEEKKNNTSKNKGKENE